MAKVSRITVVSPNYPSKYELERGAFVEALVREWQEIGKEVNVIAPSPIYSRTRKRKKTAVKVCKFAGTHILYPKYLSLTSQKIGPLNLAHLSNYGFERAVLKAQKQIDIPDIFYGKFLSPGGMSALKLSIVYGRKVFVDLGESRSLIKGLEESQLLDLKRAIQQFSGIVCVSPRLVDEVISLGVDECKILLAPNVADSRMFYPRDKAACRKELGLQQNQFLVVFVGHFIERKGPLRVLEAINALSGDAKGIFLGRGPQMPTGDNVIKAGPVSHDELPKWLCAADVMVLPTLAEGCCNAINEALACRLPLITSDIEDVRWQVEGENAVLVDPYDIEEISRAIRGLIGARKGNHELYSLSTRIDIRSRGAGILEWIEKTA